MESVLASRPPVTELREQVRASCENLPGTYRMVALDGEVLYVGKSKRVRTRLLSYFRAKRPEKAYRIVQEAHRLVWDYEPNEFAALLRELELIKRYRPRFNVRHKRDRLYSFLKLSGGLAPKLSVVRGVTDDSAAYFGPFRGGRRITAAVRELNDVLGLRDCATATPMHFADQPDLFDADLTPRCHRLELSRCAGPCAAACTRDEYLRRVELARSFLDGEADEPLEWLNRKMADAAARWEFEYAASLRDRLARLGLLREQFSRLREALESLSFVYTLPGHAGDDRLYLIRRGTIRAELPAPRTRAQRKHVARLVGEVFGRPEPESALIPKHQVDEILLLAHWFRTKPSELDRTRPATGMAVA